MQMVIFYFIYVVADATETICHWDINPYVSFIGPFAHPMRY